MNRKPESKSDEYINSIYKIREYAEEQYDKLIVYLSSGALVLTVGFVKKAVDLSKINDLFLLYLSWICFSTSLTLTLISHRTSLLTMDYEIKGAGKISDYWDCITMVLNWSSMIALVVGIISFIRFVSIALR